MTRLHVKNTRVYVDGYDLSGYERALSPATWAFDTNPDTALSDECKNIVLGHPNIDFNRSMVFSITTQQENMP